MNTVSTPKPLVKSKQEWEKHNHQCQYCGEITYWQHDNPNFESLADDVCGRCCKAVSMERQRVVEMIEGMKFRETKDSYENGYNSGLSDLQSKLEEK